MPSLGWSTRALAVTTVQQRERMTNLFNAYFRVGFPESRDMLPGSVLPLDLPMEPESRYYFVAQHRQGKGWQVDARLRRPDLDIQFARPSQ